jgi:hypothetical protein
MKLDFAEKIVDMMQNFGIEAELRSDYSGRGMMGKQTAAIVTDAKNAPLIGYYGALVIAEAEKDGDDGVEAIQDFDAKNELPRYCDTMGMQVVFY